MKYYIVFNEWNYPTESGREYIGDYDTREEAEIAVTTQGINEWDNFQEVCHDLYREASGLFHNQDGSVAGYQIHSSQWEEYDFVFRSIIIEREI